MTTTALGLPPDTHTSGSGSAALPKEGPQTPTTQNPGHKSHMEWVDVVKATSVLLVVVMHFSLVMGDVVDTDVTTFWTGFNVIIEPLRMPIFFVVSGLLASSAVNRNWGSSRRRTIGTAYLFALWSLMVAVTIAVLTPDVSWGQALTNLGSNLMLPSDGYWYLYALVLYFVLAKAVRRWPIWLILGLAAIPNLLRPETVAFVDSTISNFHSPGMVSAIPVNMVFFFVGVYAKEAIRWLSNLASWPLAAFLGTAAMYFSLARYGDPSSWDQSFLLLSLLWITAGVMVASLLSKHAATARFGAYIGVRTLPIFVMQFPLMTVAVVWFKYAQPAALQYPVVQALFPLAATATVALLSLGLYSLAMRSQFRFLFRAPDVIVNISIPKPDGPAKRSKLSSSATVSNPPNVGEPQVAGSNSQPDNSLAEAPWRTADSGLVSTTPGTVGPQNSSSARSNFLPVTSSV